MIKCKIGYGIFMWMSDERVSGRYGSFFLAPSTFDEKVNVQAEMELHGPFVGKRVKITVKVIESRQSGHAGDHFLHIKPSMPNVGEEITLGIGVLSTINRYFQLEYVLEPETSREINYIDPRVLYRLHDQTVEVFAEETSEECTPEYNCLASPGVKANGDGTIQCRQMPLPKHIQPKVSRLGEGTFLMNCDYMEGEDVLL
jgi:hypothetical protein